jgi:hypothetical protein
MRTHDANKKFLFFPPYSIIYPPCCAIFILHPQRPPSPHPNDHPKARSACIAGAQGYSAGNFPKSGKQTFWVMSPHKDQFLTLAKGIQFLSVVKKKKGRPRPKTGLQKFRVTWKHLKRGIGEGILRVPSKK